MNTFLNFLWLAFVVIALVSLFASGWKWALLFFCISCVFLFLSQLTPEGKRLSKELEKKNKQNIIEVEEKVRQKKIEAERINRQKEFAAKELDNRLQMLVENPYDAESLSFILTRIKDCKKPDLASLLKAVAIPLLQLKPLDDDVRETVFDCAKKTTSAAGLIKSSETALLFYNIVLEVLQKNSSHIPLKKYVLEVGRWKCGIERGGSVTIYDEQAIQNDILVRTNN